MKNIAPHAATALFALICVLYPLLWTEWAETVAKISLGLWVLWAPCFAISVWKNR